MALAVAAGAGVTSAQTAPSALPNLQNQAPGPDRQQDQQSDRRGERRGGPGFRNPEQRLERRLSFLHAQLRITPAQEKAWTDLANVVRAEVQRGLNDRNRFRSDDRRGPPSVVERLEQRQQRLTDRSQRLDRMLGALRPLYASFSDEQKRTADRLMFNPDGERFGRGGFGRFGGPGFGPGGPGRFFDRGYR
jgi:hypothetical protein